MPKPKDSVPGETPREFYGNELRRLREAAGLSQERLGELVFCSGGYIGMLEAATRKPQEDMSRRFGEILDTGGHFERLYPVATASRFAEYFTAAAELQAIAESICEYSPALVPGLLQAPGYARAVFESAQPLRSADDIESRVVQRMARARILTGPTAPLYWAVLDEAAIRRPVGGVAAMHELLAHLAGVVRNRRAVIQVMPFAAGGHAMLEGSICLMTFADAPPVAYIEGPHAGQLIDDPALVAKCSLSYDLVRAAALSPEASLALIEAAAEEYAHGHH
ncbi:helix-turn-helix transcriptional regulator [Kitasatospora herbaricolor]|uniref:Helix-turn-helix transcriptional regulator n=1 Tax=Kitasatospora herbaricolor TaxID=68217 RepID=A0ABZ1WLA2_9ACTN